MLFNKGGPLHWAGYAQPGRTYSAGAIVAFKDGRVMAARIDNAHVNSSHAWAAVGRMGATPTTVVHSWHPKTAQYPAGDDNEMSEVVEMCSDCWKDGDYKNAFNAMAHLYVIRELGL